MALPQKKGQQKILRCTERLKRSAVSVIYVSSGLVVSRINFPHFVYLFFLNFRRTCDFLISKGADVTARDKDNMTPLHLAVKAGSLKTVNVLTNCLLPSTLEEKDHEGNTPLHLACKYNRLDVLQFLLDRGADVTVRNQGNMTCLDVAIEWEAEEVAKTLVKHQRYVYIRTNSEYVFPLISTDVSIIIITIIFITSVYLSY